MVVLYRRNCMSDYCHHPVISAHRYPASNQHIGGPQQPRPVQQPARRTGTGRGQRTNRCQQRPATAHNARTIRTRCGLSGLKNAQSFDGAAPPEPGLRTAGACPRDAPERPSRANDHHQQQPANMKLAEAKNPRSTHRYTLVMRRSLGDDEDQATTCQSSRSQGVDRLREHIG